MSIGTGTGRVQQVCNTSESLATCVKLEAFSQGFLLLGSINLKVPAVPALTLLVMTVEYFFQSRSASTLILVPDEQ